AKDDGDRRFAVDAVCLGYGFQPSNEILRALGCRHIFDETQGQFTTVVDDEGRTSLAGVFSLGDCTGLGGARAALAEGTVVGHGGLSGTLLRHDLVAAAGWKTRTRSR